MSSGRISWSEECFGLLGHDPRTTSPSYELWLNSIHPEDRDRADRTARRALREQREVDLEFRVPLPDGVLRWVNMRGRTVCDAAGRPEQVVGIIFDITERKGIEARLQRSNRRLEVLSEVTGRLLASAEPQAIVNELCQKVMAFLDCHVFFNFLVDETEPCRLRLNACGGIPADVAKSIEWLEFGIAVCGCVARDGCRVVAEDIPSTPDPRTELVKSFGVKAYACHPLMSQGRVIGTLSFGTLSRTRFEERELSLMKAVADHIAIAMERIRQQQELQRNQQRLRQALEQADAANRAKDQFLAVLSHELRTPLTPVLMTASALQADASLPVSVREDLATIRHHVELEARLIDDLLDLTRIVRGRLRLETGLVDAHRELRSAIAICEADMQAKRMRPEVSLAAEAHDVVADRARLHQIFWNIVKNAVKFTPQGGRIAIRTWNEPAAGEDRPRLSIEIADSGIGVAPQDMERIFNAFERGGPAAGQQFGGLGLGLAISKALVEMHGGTIEAHSEGKGKGASFTVSLPLHAEAGQAPTSSQSRSEGEARLATAGDGARAGHAPPLRILLVEDHAVTAALLARLLRSMNHDVQAAGCVRDAIRLAESSRFDLLISDVGLPDGTGLELMKQLKAQYGLRGIAMSGYGMEEDIQNSRSAGFEAHLTKPVSIQQLEAALGRVSSS